MSPTQEREYREFTSKLATSSLIRKLSHMHWMGSRELVEPRRRIIEQELARRTGE